MRSETRVGIFVLIAVGIFFYLSINIGAFRMDRDLYNEYKTYFDDTGGLDPKAAIKIAGVDVGWVEAIHLLEDGKAEIKMLIHKKNRLSRNAYALIQQEGLIGSKHIEIDPGDPSTGYLPPGSILTMPGRSPSSIGDLLDQFRDIAGSIHDIATSVRNVFATRQGEDDMRKSLTGIALASERIASVSEILERTLKKNEQNINNTLIDLKGVARHLESGVPTVTKGVDNVTQTLNDKTLPKINTLSDKAGSAFESFDHAAVTAREGLKEAEQVMEKINTGKGLLGKLINEDETYGDVKKTLHGIKSYVNKVQSLGIYFDMHSEYMLKTSFTKGYAEIKLRPASDYFYQLQIVADDNGTVVRDEIHRTFKDSNGSELKVNELVTEGRDKLRFAEDIEFTTQRKFDVLFGLQFGKRFNRIALRAGLFENTFGMGIDYYVPLKTDKFHWITTFEAWDFRGVNRINDSRPHLKWINRAYFLKNMYTAFGIDDLYSNRSANPFFGGGFRFGDDDLKYFFSFLPMSSFNRPSTYPP